jgi:hypothetical protein
MSTEQPAPLLYLVNRDTLEKIEMQGNPPSISGEVKVAYNRFKIPGASHQPMMFSNTENHKTPPIEFEFYGDTQAERNLIDDKFRLWQSWLIPKAADDLFGAAPPRLLFVWPKVVSLQVVITDWKYHYKEFNADGEPTWLVVTSSFEEISDERILPDVVKNVGLQRAAFLPGGQA